MQIHVGVFLVLFLSTTIVSAEDAVKLTVVEQGVKSALDQFAAAAAPINLFKLDVPFAKGEEIN